LRLAAVALDLGLSYRAPGIVLDPPPQQQVGEAAVLTVIGTGKRTGKTAVAAQLAMTLRERGVDPVIVSMGRGGPPEPQLVAAGEQLDRARLLEIARGGAHAASDYLEDALLTGVATVGTRRCGEGPAGQVFESNVAAGVRLALSLDPGVVVLEGSGASLPPVAADRTVCVTLGEPESIAGLGRLRLMRADLVIALGTGHVELPHGRVIRCELEPEPATPVPAGVRVAVFTTARPEHAEHVRHALARSGLEIAFLSTNLARRGELARDLDEAGRSGAGMYLTELKAAAIDTVAERADRDGLPVGWLRNRVVPRPGELDLDQALWSLFGAPVST
jgi:cyclic 2,3-diphosphoglycerate synthetase